MGKIMLCFLSAVFMAGACSASDNEGPVDTVGDTTTIHATRFLYDSNTTTTQPLNTAPPAVSAPELASGASIPEATTAPPTSTALISLPAATSEVDDATKSTIDAIGPNNESGHAVPPPRDEGEGGYASTLKTLTVAPECDRSTYDRDDWPHWNSWPGPISNVRHYLLTEESLAEVEYSSSGNVTEGEWLSKYDGFTSTNPREFDIDHIVPLAEAHDSGGCGWNRDMRKKYANDLDGLIAVSAKSNRSKSDRDPQNWMPPDAGYHCEYLYRWVEVKSGWALHVDEIEFDFLVSYQDEC